MPVIDADADTSDQRSVLRTRAGLLTLLLLCGVQFLDVVDASITNVAFPSIQRALLVCSIFVLAAALIASRTPNARAAAAPVVAPGQAATESA